MPPDPSPLPAIGQQVGLRSAGVGTTGTVTDREGDLITLTGVGERAGGQTEIVFSHAGGVACLTGELIPGDALSHFRITGVRRVDQRREAFRVGVTGRVSVRGQGGEGAEVELHDLSARGMSVLARDISLRVGEPVTVSLSLEDDELTVAGRVVRTDERMHGIRFEHLTRTGELALSRFVMEQQRRRVRVRD